MTSDNRYTIITGCTPSASCPLCQEGRKRFRHKQRNPASIVTKFEHIGKVGDTWQLVLCQDQRPPEADLTQRF